jgi:hypothetical protein
VRSHIKTQPNRSAARKARSNKHEGIVNSVDININLKAKHWPGLRTRLVVAAVVIVALGHWAGGALLPVGIGAVLGAWLGVGVSIR